MTRHPQPLERSPCPIRQIQRGKRFRASKLHLMKTIHACLVAAATSFVTGCAVSPDYSNYDWHTRGGNVEEQDRALASARIEPFQSRRSFARTNEPLTPVGAPPSREAEVRIDPTANRPIAQMETRTVTSR